MNILNDNNLKIVNGKFVFLEQQLIKKENLYKRWVGATDEEIAAHYEGDELRAYRHYKGPINKIIWCDLGDISYRNIYDCSNSSQYEFNDKFCDYFLLVDVERCEAEHPEYIANITPESLGLVQNELPNLHHPIQQLETQLAEAQATPESTTQVNAAMWEASCRAACTLLVEIMENPQATDLIKNEFLDMLGKKYSGKGGVHSKVETIAWAALPASKKHGAGCPKKNPKNS